MITLKDFYEVLSALVPLYVVIILAYGSVRWWKIFTPNQCAGINRFVTVFAIPLLSFHFISNNNPYAMNFRFIAADCLQKFIILILLFIYNFTKFGNLEWSITFFSLSTLPNTLVMGVPLLTAMYGEFSENLMVQVVVLQIAVWYNLLIFLFEYRGANILISEQFPAKVVRSIASVEVESDVVSLSSREGLYADAEIRNDGKYRVVVRRSDSFARSVASQGLVSVDSIALRDQDLSEMEIYSLPSSREGTPKVLSLKEANLLPMLSRKVSNLRAGIKGNELLNRGTGSASVSSYPVPDPSISVSFPTSKHHNDLHMFVWSTSSAGQGIKTVSINSRDNYLSQPALQQKTDDRGIHILKTETERNRELGVEDESKKKDLKHLIADSPLLATQTVGETGEQMNDESRVMPPATVVTRLIITIVWRKLVRNPNTYAGLLGVIWSLISFRFHIKLPKIIDKSITMLSSSGLGMAMFSLGLFAALQPKIITCGKRVALFSMVIRFLLGPLVIAVTSTVIGIRGDLLRVAVLQAALPCGIAPFVFAKEYSCHAEVIITAIIFGTVVALPVTIIYYILLGLK